LEIWVDGQRQFTDKLETPETHGTHRYYWDATKHGRGKHTIRVIALTADGSGSAERTVFYGPAEAVRPAVLFRSPAENQTLTGSIPWEIEVTGTTPRWAMFFVDGRFVASKNSPPFMLMLSTERYTDGSHVLHVAVGLEQSGQKIESEHVRVVFQNSTGGTPVPQVGGALPTGPVPPTGEIPRNAEIITPPPDPKIADLRPPPTPSGLGGLSLPDPTRSLPGPEGGVELPGAPTPAGPGGTAPAPPKTGRRGAPEGWRALAPGEMGLAAAATGHAPATRGRTPPAPVATTPPAPAITAPPAAAHETTTTRPPMVVTAPPSGTSPRPSAGGPGRVRAHPAPVGPPRVHVRGPAAPAAATAPPAQPTQAAQPTKPPPPGEMELAPIRVPTPEVGARVPPGTYALIADHAPAAAAPLDGAGAEPRGDGAHETGAGTAVPDAYVYIPAGGAASRGRSEPDAGGGGAAAPAAVPTGAETAPPTETVTAPVPTAPGAQPGGPEPLVPGTVGPTEPPKPPFLQLLTAADMELAPLVATRGPRKPLEQGPSSPAGASLPAGAGTGIPPASTAGPSVRLAGTPRARGGGPR
jgi:hypothetical protein